MRRTISLVALLTIVATGAVLAQPAGGPNQRQAPALPPTPAPPPPQPSRPAPPPPPAPVQAPVWDTKGWTMLGEQPVNGNVDKDRIMVGRYEGKFNKLTVVVLDSDLEMIDFKIVFGDRSEYNPKVSQFFKENTRTRVIDLPPSEQIINRIDFKYRNLPGGGRARVQVWGFKVGNAAPPPPVKPVVVNWDSTGWTKLGERDVDGRVDKDRLEVGRYEGKFSKLTIVVRDSDLEMIDFSVKFGRGPEWRPNVNHYFRENQRTRVIDFPGDERVIKYIDFKYRNLPGGGRAKVEVWGFRTDGPPPQPMKPVVVNWDSTGWTKLGERDVDGRVDNDRLEVGRYEGKFSKLTVVVRDSDLEMIDFSVKFGRGPEWRPNVNHYFRENQRTRVIDFPGDERVIKYIDFKYRNLPGGGRAKVEVWGYRTDVNAGPAKPNTFDSRGWTQLGERTVNGRRADKDKIEVGREEGKFRRLTIVVLDSDLMMLDMEIKFGRGAPMKVDVRQEFRENSRTRVIDLPGDDRVIKWIEFKYKNLPGGGNARVQVWAQ